MHPIVQDTCMKPNTKLQEALEKMVTKILWNRVQQTEGTENE